MGETVMERKKNEQVPIQTTNFFSKQEIIEIQAEAYYQAFKRIEQDKAEVPQAKTKRCWWETTLLLLNIILFPWKLHKKLAIKNMPETLLGSLIVLVLMVFGCITWFLGIASLIAIIFITSTTYKLMLLPFSILLTIIGSEFIIASNSLDRIEETTKIENFASSIMGTLAVIIALISLAISFFHR